jgi:protein-tyrosine-phosphatase
MLGYMLTSLAEDSGQEWTIRTAGTHVTEGSAMSSRTRDALMNIEGLGDHRYGAHRSHQIVAADAVWADVILAAEASNVSFVRTNFTKDAVKAVQLTQFVRYAPLLGNLDAKLAVVNAQAPAKKFDVDDPAGGDQATYDQCARQLWELARSFAKLVEGETVD